MACMDESSESRLRKLITSSEIEQEDVLLGRGALCTFHVGTIAWKAIVESRLDLYHKAKSKQITNLTLSVLNMVHATGGRFLQHDSSAARMGFWFEMDDKEARIKVRDAFRQCIKNLRQHRLPSALVDRLGISRLLNKHLTYSMIVDYVSKSTEIQEIIRSGRNDMIERRERKGQTSAASLLTSNFHVPPKEAPNAIYTGVSIDIWIPEGDNESEPDPTEEEVDAIRDEEILVPQSSLPPFADSLGLRVSESRPDSHSIILGRSLP